MTDDLLARLGDLRDEMDRALSRFQTSVDALGPTTGSDKTEAVTVRLDRDGALRSVAVTSDWKTRISPRLIAATVPAAGAVWSTPGVFLSSNSGCPRRTRSPSFTSSVGRIP